jgi:hypothetical protein
MVSAGGESSTRKFPMSPESLDGRRVLLIVIPASAARTACFLTGTAKWTGEDLEVQSAPDSAPVVAKGTRVALQGFNPALLPRLIVPSDYPQVAQMAQGVAAAVAIFAPSAPEGAMTLESPFFGLAHGKDNQVFLMQGDPGAH